MRPTRAALFTTFVFALILAATPLHAQTAPAFTSPRPTESYTGPRPGGLLPSSLFDPSRFSILAIVGP